MLSTLGVTYRKFLFKPPTNPLSECRFLPLVANMHKLGLQCSRADHTRTISSLSAGNRVSTGVLPRITPNAFVPCRHFARSRRGPSTPVTAVAAVPQKNEDEDEDLGDDDFYSDDLPAIADRSAPSASSSDLLALADPMQLLPESGKCVGCGIDLQCEDEGVPGFFRIPKRLAQRTSKIPAGVIAIEPDSPLLEDPGARREAEQRGLVRGQGRPASPSGGPGDVQAAYEGMVEEWLEKPDAGDFGAPSGPLSQRPRTTREARREMIESRSQILCARCFSLKHEGRLKAPEMERLLPGFDLLKAVGPYLANTTPGKSTVVVAVVDAADFDGSLPRNALKALWPKDREGRPVRPRGTHLVLVANKADLLPPYVSAKRLQEWVKRRTKQAGLPDPTDIHLVSAQEGRGVPELIATLEKLGQPKGNIFIVGAQNAGKSTLLNALREAKGLPANLTIAALPGTTLGLVKVNGVFPHYIRLFDTPGVPHPYQLSARLTPEEVRMLLPRKQLRPRTFAMKMRQSLHIGGLARVDVKRTPGTGPIYVTLWASMDVSCFWGSTESAAAFHDAHVGRELTPPVGDLQRLRAMGPLIPSVVALEGASWREASVDVAIAGLGWFGVTVDGRCELEVWAHDGVAITTHQALVPDHAKDWERPGYDTGAKMLAATKRAEEEKKRRQEEREAERAKRKAGKGEAGRAAGDETASEGPGGAAAAGGKKLMGRAARMAKGPGAADAADTSTATDSESADESDPSLTPPRTVT